MLKVESEIQSTFLLSLQHRYEVVYPSVFHSCNFVDHILCSPSFKVVDEVIICVVWHDTLAIWLVHCVNSNALDKFVKRWVSVFSLLKPLFRKWGQNLEVLSLPSLVTTLCGVETSSIMYLISSLMQEAFMHALLSYRVQEREIMKSW